MSYLNFFIFLTFCLVSFVEYSSAIKCFSCNRCSDPFSPENTRIVDCGSSRYFECATVTVELWDEQHYYRNCQRKNSLEGEECQLIKDLRSGFSTSATFSCQKCDEDICNDPSWNDQNEDNPDSGAHIAAPLFLIIFAVILGLFH